MRTWLTATGLLAVLGACSPMNYGPTLDGDWSLVSVHHSPVAEKSVESAAQWIGQSAEFQTDEVAVAEQECSEPAFDTDWQPLQDVLTDFELPADAFSMPPEAPVQSLHLSCEGEPWSQPGGHFIRLNEQRLLMIWQGIFFEFHPA